jgi:hypothetical protein
MPLRLFGKPSRANYICIEENAQQLKQTHSYNLDPCGAADLLEVIGTSLGCGFHEGFGLGFQGAVKWRES